MDPGICEPRNPQSPGRIPPAPGSQLIVPPHYDAISEHVSSGLTNQPLVKSLLEDVAVRSLSSPSIHASQERLSIHIEAANTAYAKAYVAIQRSVKRRDAVEILTHSSKDDVSKTALELLSSSSSEDNERATTFINILHHYSGVFDVLSQAGNFAYLAVIWGGMKMLLLMAKNKKELLTKVTDMLVQIGLVLPRIEGLARRFPSPRMIELICSIYAAVAEFLEDIVVHFTRRSAFRTFVSSSLRPFEEKFGRSIERIKLLRECINEEAMLLHIEKTDNIAKLLLNMYLERVHMTTTLDAHAQLDPLASTSAAHPPVPAILDGIKETLFRGLRDQATYHESLAATYRVTARAWEEWFAVEQRHLPSSPSLSSSLSTPRLSQGLCDAPDHQHALQWLSQQRRIHPNIPSCYLIWAPGMTVHTAIASLVLQVLLQRPGAVVEYGLNREGVFDRARTSVTALWGLFTYLMRAMGGCLVYISIGSAGEEEFVIVEQFVRTVKGWDGPPIWVTIIHPYNEGFVGINEATDLDGLYDVHPSLTTTDALHHVLMLELDIHQVSETIQTVLWEAAWRETRYASVGISFTKVAGVIEELAKELAKELSREEVDGVPVLTDVAREQWMEGVGKWLNHPGASNCMREVIQRHLDIVPLALPDDIRAEIERYLKRLVLRVDQSKAESFASRSMTETQRYRVWDEMKAAIIPGSEAMFCTPIREMLSKMLETFSEMPYQTPKQAVHVIMRLLNGQFGADGAWRSSMSLDEQLMVKGIKEAVMTGFARTIEALSEPEGPEEVSA
ncbi:hypothetical protein C7999DRAFT_17471 [Corynascus novoguineensis]|uniref:DUF7708 domain-containing protein n=1 Tax=Corynascus novoguineensis TaxID=1126955 RepID=A0AAN7CMA0_9PEZI|nr:hypothetical protein C7999DRAFT_17471 [Corynascus novoguineensis]